MTVTESEFYMWRALFALAHADNVVSEQEIRFMSEIMEDVSFSEEQTKILRSDIQTAQDPYSLFAQIEQSVDQARFFALAKQMVWVDGDFGHEEQAIMLMLKQKHVQNVSFEDLVEHVHLELEAEELPQLLIEDDRKPARMLYNPMEMLRRMLGGSSSYHGDGV